jgi:Kdo2-lipid IVA lauroyltransferase/acyltransferase
LNFIPEILVFFKFLSWWPLWLLHAMGWLFGWLIFLLSLSYRRCFLVNARAAGLRSAQWLPAVGAAGQLLAEIPRLWLGRPVSVQWQGEEVLQQALQAQQGVVFLTPHLGCFEITAQAYAHRYGQAGHPMTVLFRTPRQAALAQWVSAARARPGLYTAPTTLAGVKKLLKVLKMGQCVGLLPDQVPPAGQGVWVPFFAQNAYTMTLSARLAIQTGATILLAWGERLSWGRGYVIHVLPFNEALQTDVEQAAAQLNRAMERLILQAPGQYLWGYERYKTPREHL